MTTSCTSQFVIPICTKKCYDNYQTGPWERFIHLHVHPWHEEYMLITTRDRSIKKVHTSNSMQLISQEHISDVQYVYWISNIYRTSNIYLGLPIYISDFQYISRISNIYLGLPIYISYFQYITWIQKYC